MLKFFSQNLAKAYSTPYSVVSLASVPQAFKSRIKKSRAEKIKRYLQDPRYKKVVRMKVPDLNDPNIVFPISIPLKTNFVWRPGKSQPPLPEHDFINFKNMTGNEILLNLSNVEKLRPTEFASAMLELSKRETPVDMDWNQHEWIIKCTEVAIKYLSQYDARVVASLLWAFHKLNIKEPLLWSTFQRETSKTIHKLKGKGFGLTYIVFASDPERCTREFLEKLTGLIPIHIQGFNPMIFTKVFELVLKNNLMNDYLFDTHFFMVIWKKNAWLQAKNYPSLIRGLLELGYKDDLEFWNTDFVPSIEKMIVKMNAKEAEDLLAALNEAKEQIPDLEIKFQANLLKERIVFAKTTLQRVENAKFWNIVKNDLEYYREKERLRLEKERASA